MQLMLAKKHFLSLCHFCLLFIMIQKHLMTAFWISLFCMISTLLFFLVSKDWVLVSCICNAQQMHLKNWVKTDFYDSWFFDFKLQWKLAESYFVVFQELVCHLTHNTQLVLQLQFCYLAFSVLDCFSTENNCKIEDINIQINCWLLNCVMIFLWLFINFIFMLLLNSIFFIRFLFSDISDSLMLSLTWASKSEKYLCSESE